jgi:hypothetical protein
MLTMMRGTFTALTSVAARARTVATSILGLARTHFFLRLCLAFGSHLLRVVHGRLLLAHLARV